MRYAITSNGAAVWDLGSDPLGAVYSRYANAAERQTSEPTCLLRRLMPVETARAAFDLFMEYPGGMGVFWNGYSVKDQASVDFAAARWRACTPPKPASPTTDASLWCVTGRVDEPPRPRGGKAVPVLCRAGPGAAGAGPLPCHAGRGSGAGLPENIEVTAAGVDKGEALLTLADRLGIPAHRP